MVVSLAFGIGKIEFGAQVFMTMTMGLFVFIMGNWQGRQNLQNQESKKIDANVCELVLELAWMNSRKNLTERTHPGLIAKLDRLSLARNEIISALNRSDWLDKSKSEPWKSVVKGCFETADEAVYDAIWIGRHLFRRKGHRSETFARRCSEPDFGVRALESVECIVQEVEHLAANIKGEEETNQSILVKTQKRLDELMRAEAELGQEPEFLDHELE